MSLRGAPFFLSRGGATFGSDRAVPLQQLNVRELYSDCQEYLWLLDYPAKGQRSSLLSLKPPATSHQHEIQHLVERIREQLDRIKQRLEHGQLIRNFDFDAVTMDFFETRIWPCIAEASDFFDKDGIADRLSIVESDDDWCWSMVQRFHDNGHHYLYRELGSLLGEVEVAEYLGNGRIQLPGRTEPIIVDEQYIKVVEYLIEHRAVRSKEFEAIDSNVSQTLGKLRKDYPELASYVTRPGKSGKGKGYTTTIQDARSKN